MSIVIHIVGRALGFGSLQRQLCAWCGERLIDDDLSLMASADGKPPGMWKEGGLLEVDKTVAGVTRASVVAHEDGAELPLNCCATAHLVKLRLVGGVATEEEGVHVSPLDATRPSPGDWT